MEKVDITIIGAGIIGLAISAYVSQANSQRSVYVLEKNLSFGQETSSRNSEVIHSGLYYPQNSLKAKTCVEGSRMIYQLCAKNNIPCKKPGKLIVASEEAQLNELERLLEQGKQNGVLDLKILSRKEVKSCEFNINAQAALYSPDTGIIDAYSLMRYFFQQAKAQGAEFAFHCEIMQIDRESARANAGNGYQLTIRDADGNSFSFFTELLINCAGLNSDSIAKMAGIDLEKNNYLLKFCKGDYFRLGAEKSSLVRHLVYPVPRKDGFLGVHATPDLGGGLRLGPDAQYIEKEQVSYDIDNSKKDYFCQAVNRFLPFIKNDDLSADTSGIRPRLQGPENGFRDFIISEEEEKGFPGLINLIGIESPGLTAAPAIAKYVGKELVNRLL